MDEPPCRLDLDIPILPKRSSKVKTLTPDIALFLAEQQFCRRRLECLMRYFAFCDESRHTHRAGYMVLGGIIFAKSNLARIDTEIERWNASDRKLAEVKWKRCWHRNEHRYHSMLDLFTTLNCGGLVDFHSLTVENSTRDDAHFNDGDFDVGYYKLYYQLVFHRFAKLYLNGPDDDLIIRLDNRSSRYDLNDLTLILNRVIKRDIELAHDPIRRIMPVDSQDSRLIQIADVLVGGIGYRKNRENLEHSEDRAKSRVSRRVLEVGGIPDVNMSTRIGERRFSLWNFRYN